MSTDEVLFLLSHDSARPDRHLFSVRLCKSSLTHLHASSLLQPFTVSRPKKCPEPHSFLSSALGEHERRVQKASWLGVDEIHEICRVDLHPSLVGDTQEKFHAMPDDRAVFEDVCVIHTATQVCLVRLVWRCLEETTGNPAGGIAPCLSVYRKPGKTVPVLAGQHGIGLGSFKAPQ